MGCGGEKVRAARRMRSPAKHGLNGSVMNNGLTQRRRLAALALGGALCLMAAGCGQEGIARRTVSGEVTLDGKPLAEGRVMFSPLGEGGSAGGPIEGGKFSLPLEQGPTPGEYHVHINRSVSTISPG